MKITEDILFEMGFDEEYRLRPNNCEPITVGFDNDCRCRIVKHDNTGTYFWNTVETLDELLSYITVKVYDSAVKNTQEKIQHAMGLK